MSDGQDTMPPAPRAVRLTFQYGGDSVRLISQLVVDKVTPPSDMIEIGESQQGLWLELRDSADKALYQHILHNPLQGDIEVFGLDPTPVARVPVSRPSGTFSVVVPHLGNSDHVMLLRGRVVDDAPPTPGATEPAGPVELAQVMLRSNPVGEEA